MPLKFVRQNITKVKCDAIVNPTYSFCSQSDSVDAMIRKAAEEAPCLDLVKHKHIINVIVPICKNGYSCEETLFHSCYLACLDLALRNDCESVAFPLIFSDACGIPKDRILKIAINAISGFLFKNEMLVYIVLDKASYAISEKLFMDVRSYIRDNLVEYLFSGNKSLYQQRKQVSTNVFSKIPIYDNDLDDIRLILKKPKSSDGFDDILSIKCKSPQKSGDTHSEKTMSSQCSNDMLGKNNKSSKNLDDMLSNMDKSFAETLFDYIDKKGISDVECYKRANVDKKTFSKIKCNKDYRPSKITVVSFAIALRLNMKETEHLLNTVGLSLSRSYKFDVIIEYFITTGNYKDIFDVNETLYQFDQMTLGV